jgi:hypothetical protein
VGQAVSLRRVVNPPYSAAPGHPTGAVNNRAQDGILPHKADKSTCSKLTA